MHPSTRQGVAAELRHILAPGWSYELCADHFLVTGPGGDTFEDEVWRVSRFVSYRVSTCIERTGDAPLEYRLTSRGRGDLYLVIVFRAATVGDERAR